MNQSPIHCWTAHDISKSPGFFTSNIHAKTHTKNQPQKHQGGGSTGSPAANLGTFEQRGSSHDVEPYGTATGFPDGALKPWSNLFLKQFDVDVLEDGKYGIAKCDGETESYYL